MKANSEVILSSIENTFVTASLPSYEHGVYYVTVHCYELLTNITESPGVTR